MKLPQARFIRHGGGHSGPASSARIRHYPHDDLHLLAAVAAVAILANAVVCGVLSGPHDRYGARLAWIATFALVIAGLRAFEPAPESRFRGVGREIVTPLP